MRCCFSRRERKVVVLPREIDFLAGLGSESGKGDDGAGGSGLKRPKNRASGAAENLETHFPGAGLDGRSRRGRGNGHAAGQIAGGDEAAGRFDARGEHSPCHCLKDLGDGYRTPGSVLRWRRPSARMRSTLPLESLTPMMFG